MNIKLRFKGTFLGFIWAALEPLFIFLLLYIVFTSIRSSNRDDFAIYLISGIMLYHLFIRGTQSSVTIFGTNFPILISLNIRREFFPVVSTVSIGLLMLSVFIIFSLVIFFGTNMWGYPRGWSGGFWGPRILIPALPFLALIMCSVILKFDKPYQKIVLIILGVIGFIINLIGSLVYYMYGLWYIWSVDKLAGNMVYSLVLWDPTYSPIAKGLQILSSDYITTLYQLPPNFARWGLSPCRFDVYLYCEFGIIPVIILAGIITIVAVSIIKTIKTKELIKS